MNQQQSGAVAGLAVRDPVSVQFEVRQLAHVIRLPNFGGLKTDPSPTVPNLRFRRLLVGNYVAGVTSNPATALKRRHPANRWLAGCRAGLQPGPGVT